MRSSAGFTLIEILLVLGITLVLVGMTAMLTNRTTAYGYFDRTRETIRSELTAARADTVAGTLDSSWGVEFSDHSITRYRGSSYSSRNSAYDNILLFGNTFTLSGATDTAFLRPNGTVTSTVTFVLTDGTRTATGTINTAGTIDIE